MAVPDRIPKPVTIRLSGQVTPRDKARSDYCLLPFSVPPGVRRLRVRYAYSGRISAAQTGEPGNVIDIGLFDPCGSAFLRGEGFRGWSGSARQEFTLGPEWATPGYLPGPISPGRWEILLGLYRIAPEGCRYEVAVTLEFGLTDASQMESGGNETFHFSQRNSNEERWYPGDLHAHTHHSDASGSLEDLVAVARARGLAYLAVTEHNTISHIPYLARFFSSDLILISGQEVTTYYGHANVWGLDTWLDFRCRMPAEMARVLKVARTAGGLCSINHPKSGGPPWEYGLYDQVDCLEVWQGPWFFGNHESLALWDHLLRQGVRLVAVGGSDRHQPPFNGQLGIREVGSPTTWVYARELSAEAILAGIRAGHVTLSADVGGPRLFLEADADGDGRYEVLAGDRLRLAPGSVVRWRCRVEGGAGHLLRVVSPGQEWSTRVKQEDFAQTWEAPVEGDTYYRAELIVPDEADLALLMRAALCNPIYVSATSDGDAP